MTSLRTRTGASPPTAQASPPTYTCPIVRGRLRSKATALRPGWNLFRPNRPNGLCVSAKVPRWHRRSVHSFVHNLPRSPPPPRAGRCYQYARWHRPMLLAAPSGQVRKPSLDRARSEAFARGFWKMAEAITATTRKKGCSGLIPRVGCAPHLASYYETRQERTPGETRARWPRSCPKTPEWGRLTGSRPSHLLHNRFREQVFPGNLDRSGRPGARSIGPFSGASWEFWGPSHWGRPEETSQSRQSGPIEANHRFNAVPAPAEATPRPAVEVTDRPAGSRSRGERSHPTACVWSGRPAFRQSPDNWDRG